MKIYMVRTIRDKYCVFSETAMNTSNNTTEQEALNNYYAGLTFVPASPNVRYTLSTDLLSVCYADGVIFGEVIYEILVPTDTSTYEYW